MLLESIRTVLGFIALRAGISDTWVVILGLAAGEHFVAAKTLVVYGPHRCVLPNVNYEASLVWDVSAAELTSVVHGVLLQHVHLVLLRVGDGNLAELTKHFGLDGVGSQLGVRLKAGVAVATECVLVWASIIDYLRTCLAHSFMQQMCSETGIETIRVLITFIYFKINTGREKYNWKQ